MPVSRPTLVYAEPQRSTVSDWLASLSVFCITFPAFIFVAEIILVLLGAPRALFAILTVVAFAGPVLGFSFAVTALVLGTGRKRTAVAGLIGCLLWILLLFIGPIITFGFAPRIAPPPAPPAAGPR